jgi:hypothetical protein
MERTTLTVACGISLVALVGCGEGPTPFDQTQLARYEGAQIDGADLPPGGLARARQTADDLTTELAGLVFSTLEEQGAVAAVEVCSGVAQDRTAAHASEGVRVRRVSDRLRNPLNAPDDAEARELAHLADRHAEGLPPEEIVRFVREGNRSWLHYMRPIVLAPACLTCHGPVEAIDPEVRALLRQRYPEDRATGYSAGDLRGAVSVRLEIPVE